MVELSPKPRSSRFMKLGVASSLSSLSSIGSPRKSGSAHSSKKKMTASIFNKKKKPDHIFIEVEDQQQVTTSKDDEISWLESRLKEIKERKQLEIQNVQDWKNEKKWRLDKEYRSDDDNKVHFSVQNTNDNERKDIDDLKESNEVLRKIMTKLEQSRDEKMVTNIQLRKDYEEHRTLVREIKETQESIQAEKRQKDIFHDAIDHVVDVLHSRCNDMELVIDAVVLANKTKKKYPKQENENEGFLQKKNNNNREEEELRDETCSLSDFSDTEVNGDDDDYANNNYYNKNKGIKVISSKAPKTTAAAAASGAKQDYNDGIKVTSLDEKKGFCAFNGYRASSRKINDYNNTGRTRTSSPDDGIKVTSVEEKKGFCAFNGYRASSRKMDDIRDADRTRSTTVPDLDGIKVTSLEEKNNDGFCANGYRASSKKKDSKNCRGSGGIRIRKSSSTTASNEDGIKVTSLEEKNKNGVCANGYRASSYKKENDSYRDADWIRNSSSTTVPEDGIKVSSLEEKNKDGFSAFNGYRASSETATKATNSNEYNYYDDGIRVSGV